MGKDVKVLIWPFASKYFDVWNIYPVHVRVVRVEALPKYGASETPKSLPMLFTTQHRKEGHSRLEYNAFEKSNVGSQHHGRWNRRCCQRKAPPRRQGRPIPDKVDPSTPLPNQRPIRHGRGPLTTRSPRPRYLRSSDVSMGNRGSLRSPGAWRPVRNVRFQL